MKFQAPGAVLSVAITDDAQAVVAASDDEQSRIYNPQTGQLIGEPNRAGRINGDLPDGQTIFSAPWEGKLKLRDAHSGGSLGDGFRGWQTKAVGFSPDGRWAAVGQFRGVVTLTEIATGKQHEVELFNRNFPVEGLAFSADGARLLAVSRQGPAKFVDVARAADAGMLDDSLSTLVCGLPDGRFVSRSADGAGLEVRDFATGKVIQPPGRPTGHTGPINAIAVARTDGAVVTVSQDATARVWNLEEGTSQILWKHGAPLKSAAFSQSGAHLVLAADDGAVRVLKNWRRETSPQP
ncbi:MAG: hypothetical protein RIC55_10205 [Pirellulaceae bacterium]